jgi:predicted negative regulator of RcsB-dependent stress response
MAKFDLHEQEQISNLKYFWQRGGKYIASLVVVGLIAYAIDGWWVWHNTNRAANAATIYATFTDAYTADNKDKVLNITKDLQQNYPKTEYATMASLLSAKTAWANKDLSSAAKLLNWVIDNSADNGMVSTARLRLADIYIDEKKFDKAIRLMFEKHDPVFDPLYYTKRGDLYVAQGDLNKARDAYKEALQKAGQDPNMSQGIQMRLDILGNN